ncbi:MAG TPA: ABC transporter permease [Gemmatimonadaceae bacterium]|nr:ABC transporter permease [Gemmatimonadaceae bacterium]
MRWIQWIRETHWTHWIRRRSDDDFAAEIESHLALEAERLERDGMSADDARFAARREFGNPTSSRERFRDARFGTGLDSVRQDIRYGLRAMRRSPGFTAIAVGSLAIGIGANTTMFGAIDAMLIRAPAHVKDAERIHRVYFEVPTEAGSTAIVSNQGYRTYLAFRDRVHGFETIGAFDAQTVSSGRGRDARALDAVLATPSLFTMLGVRPALGRFFDASEELDEHEHVAVLGYDTWLSQFGADHAVLGRTIDVAGVAHVIIGVAPEGFSGIDLDRVDLWLPIGVASRLVGPLTVTPNGRGYWLKIVAKRRDAAPVAQVAGEVTAVYRDLWRGSRRYDETYGKAHAILGPVVAARGPSPDAAARVSVWVAAVSLLVLLIASANVANLLLLRGLTRSREFALRLSLGATRARLVRQSLVEGMLLAAIGGICAVVLARWSASAMRTFLLPRATSDSVLAPRLLAFTAVVALGTGILASLIPALVTARRDFGPLLGAGRVAGARNRLVLQRVLIGGQVTLATLLLVGAGLFVTSLKNVRAIDLGVDVGHVLYVRLDVSSAGQKAGSPSARASTNATYQAMLETVRRIPGVAKATLTAGEPLASGWAISLHRRGAPPLAPGSPVPFARAVGSDYFETMGTELRRGRLFTPADHRPDAHVAIIDEATAKRFWPDGNGLDSCVELGSDQACTQIVGVVANTVMWDIVGDKGSIVYLPFETWPDLGISMMEVKSSGDPAALVVAVRRAVSSMSPELPWVDIQPVSRRLDPQLRPWQLGASMFTAFGALALGLAAMGIYGLLSYAVARRAHEIGIRKALGAPDGGVVRMIVRGALVVTLPGVVIGVGIALATGRVVARQLYGVSPHDPSVIVLCVCGLVAVAIVASLAPARRATRVDPMVTLRAE